MLAGDTWGKIGAKERSQYVKAEIGPGVCAGTTSGEPAPPTSGCRGYIELK